MAQNTPRPTILAITDRVGENLTNGSQIFANALLSQLSQWFDLRIVVSGATQPPHGLRPIRLGVEEEKQVWTSVLKQQVDLSAVALIYNLGATSFSCEVTRAVCQLAPDVPLVNHFQVLLREYAQYEGWHAEHADALGLVQEEVALRAVRNIFPSFAESRLAASLGWEVQGRENHVIPNAYIGSEEIEKHFNNKPFTILAAGRFSDYVKGADLLYRAFAHLFKTHPAVRLEIAGDDSRFTGLLSSIPSSAWSFLGWITRAELHAAMKSADVVVVPSRYEPFGLVAIEAMAMGTPVIAMAVGGLAEIIHHGRTGWLCPPEEGSLGLRLAMASAVDNRVRTRAMGENARQAVQQEYALARVAGKIRALLDNTLSLKADAHMDSMSEIRN